MANKRLSKLQKWILLECYKVTMLNDRSDLKPIRFNHVNLKNDFFAEDILYNYFNLEVDTTKHPDNKVIHFKRTDNSNKAYVATWRSIKNLQEKELIYTNKPMGVFSLHIELTDDVKEIMKTLNVNDRK